MTRDEVIKILNDWNEDNLIGFRKPTLKRVFRGTIEIYNTTSTPFINNGLYAKCLKEDIYKLFVDTTDEPISSVEIYTSGEIYTIGNKYFYLGVYTEEGTRYLWDD